MVGVDLQPQPEYPGPTLAADVLTLDAEWIAGFDLVWASPPCQFASSTRNLYDPARELDLPDLVAPTRELLIRTRRPFVMENVPGAGLRADVTLCGRMFGLGVVRHREFELGGWLALQPAHLERCRGREDTVTVAGGGASRHGFVTVEAARAAIGAPHLRTRWAIDQAVPPAYACWLASQWVAWIVSSGAGVASLVEDDASAVAPPAGGVASCGQRVWSSSSEEASSRRREASPARWASSLLGGDASSDVGVPSLRCRCGAQLVPPSDVGGRPAKWCSKRCRQAAWRARDKEK